MIRCDRVTSQDSFALCSSPGASASWLAMAGENAYPGHWGEKGLRRGPARIGEGFKTLHELLLCFVVFYSACGTKYAGGSIL